MRSKPAVIIVSILLAVLTIPVMALETTVTITLTRPQYGQVKNSTGGADTAVHVDLTDEQIKIITDRAWKDFDLEEEPLLRYPSFFCALNDVREGHTVLLSIKTWSCKDPDNPRITRKCLKVVAIAP